MLPIYNARHNQNNKLKHEKKKGQMILSEVFSDYLNNSTIHGISYLGGKDKNLLEKTWWVIGLLLSVTACSYFINKTWTKWKQSPVIVSFAQEHTPIWQIPFPAITVCPLNKVKKTVFNYSEYVMTRYVRTELNTWSAEDRKKFWDVSFICNTDLSTEIGGLDNVTDESIITNIKKVSPTFIETIADPIWSNQMETNFADQITSEGLCFTFNALGHNNMYTDQMKEGFHIIDHDNKINIDTDWTIENGYSTMDEENSYPLRTAQAGLVYGLNFLLYNPVYERTQYCGDDVSGFKMILHNPAEIPRIAENYFLVPGNQKVIIAVTPKVIRTSKNLMDVSPRTRNCYFANERNLRFFKIYTQYNCITECLSNVTKEHCGCVPFYLPRDNNTEICAYGNMPCLLEAKNLKYLSMLKKNKIEIDKDEEAELEIFKKCDCLVSCDYIDYESDISQADYIFEQLYLKNVTIFQYERTPINIFFKESDFLALERNELYGQTDFIANIGGVLGLFLGFSFLSLLEIVYYITLRMWCKLYNKRNNNGTRFQTQEIRVTTKREELSKQSTIISIPWVQ